MDSESYNERTQQNFLERYFFFRDPVLKRMYAKDDVRGFRARLVQKHKKESLDEIISAVVADKLRRLLMETCSELTRYLKPMGKLVIAGGGAFNIHVTRDDRVVTSDFDTKFVPTIPYDKKYFGRLQAVKLLLWDKLGSTAKELEPKVRRAFRPSKITKFLGISLANDPLVTRRYSYLRKIKKSSTSRQVSEGNSLTDVELFVLDLNVRAFSIEDGKVSNKVVGMMDLPFMRPREYGADVVDQYIKGVTYRKMNGSLTHDKSLNVASVGFLVHDLYFLQKLGLRKEKLYKDRTRFSRLAKKLGYTGNKKSLTELYKEIMKKIRFQKTRRQVGNVDLLAAAKVDPEKWVKHTTEPREKNIAKFTPGLVAANANAKIKGYFKTSRDFRFDEKARKWFRVRSPIYVKNQYTHRPKTSPRVIQPNRLDLIGYNHRRDGWVPSAIIKKATQIPFVGLRK
jgi:hypothetical protein